MKDRKEEIGFQRRGIGFGIWISILIGILRLAIFLGAASTLLRGNCKNLEAKNEDDT
jgi:hypothetical protein